MTEKTIYSPRLPQKCPIHKMWIRKGKCEQCLMAEDRRRKAAELEAGIVKPKIKIGKL